MKTKLTLAAILAIVSVAICVLGTTHLMSHKPKVAVYGRTLFPCPPVCATWDGKVAQVRRTDPAMILSVP